jgi:hypothetical protein
MQRLFPGGFLASDDGRVVVTLSAGHVCYIELTGWAGLTLRAGRPLGSSRACWAWFGLATAGCNYSSRYDKQSQKYKNFL